MLNTYMRRVVMEPVMIEEDRMVCMIEFKKMLECSCPLLVPYLDVMDFYRFQRDG